MKQSIPDHEWNKERRKQRLKHKRYDRKRHDSVEEQDDDDEDITYEEYEDLQNERESKR
jgi:hypothetical protein